MIESAEDYQRARIKTKTVTLPDSEDTMEICAFSASAMLKCVNASKDDLTEEESMCVLLTLGVPVFKDLTPDEVGKLVTREDLLFLYVEVVNLNQPDEDYEKNSSSTQEPGLDTD